MVSSLKNQGYTRIRAVDVKPLEQWYQKFDDVENLCLDLNDKVNCEIAAKDAEDIYNLAANMGGMGFIEKNKALCMLSVLINTHMLMAAQKYGAKRFFYSSSACVYNGDFSTQRMTAICSPPFSERGGCVSCSGGRWIWLGKAVLRAHVPPLHGRFWTLRARCAIP